MKKNEMMTTATANNAIALNNGALSETLNRLGYDVVSANVDENGNYIATRSETVDGIEQNVQYSVSTSEEKRCIDTMHTFANVHTLEKPMQCVTLAHWYSLNTWKEQGFKKFSDYVIMYGAQLDEVTIRKYTNIGLCFFKDSEVLEFVDSRLNGVNMSNLDIIISTFKAYAESKAIDKDGMDYRDYVSSFLDEYCTDNENGKARLHYRMKDQKALREECRVIAGKASKQDKKTKPEDSTKPEDLTATEALLLALTNYRTTEDRKQELDATIDKLIEQLS